MRMVVGPACACENGKGKKPSRTAQNELEMRAPRDPNLPRPRSVGYGTRTVIDAVFGYVAARCSPD